MKRFVLTTMAVAVLAGSAWAVEIHVPGDYPTIQEGIDASSSGDVVIVADDTWTGDGNTNLNFFIYAAGPNGASILETSDTRSGAYREYHGLSNYILT